MYMYVCMYKVTVKRHMDSDIARKLHMCFCSYSNRRHKRRFATSRPLLCRHCCTTRDGIVRRAAREEVVSGRLLIHLQEFKSD